jgi:acyl-ACP thioesterase
MSALSLFKKKYHVEYGDADYFQKLKLSNLFNYLQEISSLHSENIGIGINTLSEKYNAAWVLVRMRVDVIKCPSWNDDIVIETWPLEPKKLEFERDYIVRDTEGNVLARAVSSWVIMDLGKREICKTERIRPEEQPEYIKDRAIDCKLGKLKQFGNSQYSYKKRIGYSDIDINGHVNNSKYIDFILDCFTVEDHAKYIVNSIQISYIKEALPGDKIACYKDISALDSQTVYIEGINEKDNQPYFKAQIGIAERVGLV